MNLSFPEANFISLLSLRTLKRNETGEPHFGESQ